MKDRPQVMLTFDDGTADHFDVAHLLNDYGLKGTFGIVADKIGAVGFLLRETISQDMKDMGHCICNHSNTHSWSGNGQPKPGVPALDKDGLTADYLEAKKRLDEMGLHGDILMLPFGSTNVTGPDHLEELKKEFRWIRMTIGTPVPENLGWWAMTGGKRLYPSGYNDPVIGITAAADVRHPNAVREAVDNAIACGSLAVLVYHRVCHVVGETMDVTWERFQQDIDYIADRVGAGEIDCVTPLDLVGEKS